MTNPIITYYPNGNKRTEEYVVNDEYYRDPAIGPSRIIYYENGQVDSIEYIEIDKLHRDPVIGPAFIKYYKNDEISFKLYYINDELHNPYGPAFIHYEYHIYKWSFNGKEYTNEVNQYLNTNNLNYKKMTQTDFDIMWTMIL